MSLVTLRLSLEASLAAAWPFLGATCGITFRVRATLILWPRPDMQSDHDSLGAKTVVNTAKQTQAKFKSYTESLKSSSPDFEPSKAIEWLRSTAKSYAAIIPGASGYIDSAFDDIDAIRHKHGKEVDSILKEAYNELREITSQDGMTVASAAKGWDVLQRYIQRIAELAGDAGQDIMNNHPALKARVGGSLDQLKQMGDKYGPEAKKQVEETTQQIKEIMKNGMSVDSIPKIQSIVQDKTKKVQEIGGKVWEQGLEKAKPLLDKSPQAKKVVEENTEALKKSGNVQELTQKIKDAVSNNNVDSLKQYVEQVSKQGSSGRGSSGGGLESYLNMIPGGSQIVPDLTKLQSLAQEHGKEAEQIAKDTIKEIEEVLKKKVGEAQRLAKEAGEKGKR